MNEQTKTQANFEKLETVSSGYFSYIIGRFHQPDIHVIGVMDLDDPASWSGGETAVVFYFMITPEEFTLRKNDPSKLDELAQKLQTSMPRSRFYSATCTKKSLTPEALKEKCEAALKTDQLEGDEAFDAWKKTVQFPQFIRVPKTPFNEARHNLAVCQRSFDSKTATQEQKDEVTDLERKLGWQIFKSEAIYVSFDQCFNPRFPMIETARGDVHIYSTQELADRSAKYYADNNIYFTEIKKIEQKDIKAFLRFCEEYGVIRFRVDDGLEPVSVLLNNIIPNLDRGFIEGYNIHIRGLMLRTMQTLRLMKLHGEAMEPQRRTSVNDWFLTWNRMMLQDLGKTVLFVPCGIPAKQHDPIRQDHAYTSNAMNTIRDLMQKTNQTTKPISRPKFTGRELILNLPEGAKYPVRILKTPDEKQWLLAFTSRDQAEQFAKQSKQDDMIIAMTLDELTEMVKSIDVCSGILVDVAGIGMSIIETALDQALTWRNEGRLIFRTKPNNTSDAGATETSPPAQSAHTSDGSTEPTEVTTDLNTENQIDSDIPTEDTGEIQQINSNGTEEKVGFFSRIFGKK